jgi:hypothetical protein
MLISIFCALIKKVKIKKKIVGNLYSQTLKNICAIFNIKLPPVIYINKIWFFTFIEKVLYLVNNINYIFFL